MKKIFLTYFIILTTLCFPQTNKQIDSLYQIIRTTKSDSIKYIAYNKIAFHYIFNDRKKALEILRKAEKEALKSNSEYGYNKLINTHGIYMDVVGNSDSAQYYFTKALRLSQLNKFDELESFCINNLGMFYWNKGNFNEALIYFFKALKSSEDHNDQITAAINMNNIGLIYQEMNLFEKALVYHQKAYNIRKENNLKKEQATSLNNIGFCYKNMKRIDLAIGTYKKGLQLAKQSKNDIDYYKLLDNTGNAYFIKKEYHQAIRYYLEALGVVDKATDSNKSRLLIYTGLSIACNELNDPKTAMQYANKGLLLLKANPDYRNFAQDLYLAAAQISHRLGRYEDGKQYMDEFILLKDSLFSSTNANAIANLEVKYQTEKKEHDLAETRAVVAERELEIKRKNSEFIYLMMASIALLLIGYLFYNQQKLKNRQLKKENELRDAMAKIETQNRLQQQRLHISRDLHDNIGAQLTFIISSLDNLKFLGLSKEKLDRKIQSISNFTIDTIYELRDTIWAMNKNDITLEDLKNRITNFINNAKSSKENIDFEFIIDENQLARRTFTSVEGMNMYRIIQEAVNNALKYANATKITVEIGQTENLLKIRITDDGKGFDINNAGDGNGLGNMRKRAKELHADIEFITSADIGTKVILTKPS